MPIVTLSRMLGTTGDEIAGQVARELDARLVTKHSLYGAAQETGVTPHVLAEIQGEGILGLADRIVNAMRTMPTIPRSRGASLLDAAPLPLAHEGYLADVPTQLEVDQSARVIESVIRNLAEAGNVVIVGRAANAILRDRADALHVQVVAPLPARIDAVAGQEGVAPRMAVARIRTSDRARADYVRRYYNLNWCDATTYDLVINSARVDVPTAVKLIVDAARARA